MKFYTIFGFLLFAVSLSPALAQKRPLPECTEENEYKTYTECRVPNNKGICKMGSDPVQQVNYEFRCKDGTLPLQQIAMEGCMISCERFCPTSGPPPIGENCEPGIDGGSIENYGIRACQVGRKKFGCDDEGKWVEIPRCKSLGQPACEDSKFCQWRKNKASCKNDWRIVI